MTNLTDKWWFAIPVSLIGGLSAIWLMAAAGIRPGASFASGLIMVCCIFALSRLASWVGTFLVSRFRPRASRVGT